MQSSVDIHNARRHSRDVDSSQCLEQSKIISNSTNGDTYLKSPFTWTQRVSNENAETNVEPRGVEFSQVEER